MRKTAAISIVAAFFTGGSISVAFGEPNKLEYELRERCGKRAEQVFKNVYGSSISNTKDGQIISNYESHYNAKLNRCFYLVKSMVLNKDVTRVEQLYDVDENKEYGTFSSGRLGVVTCELSVGNKDACGSEAEWREVIKSYMDEAR